MTPSPPARKRLRTSHACDNCRARKIRCNGDTPCRSCAAAEQECTYGSEANSRGKSDLILEGVNRIETALFELNSALAAQATNGQQPVSSTAAPSTNVITSPRGSWQSQQHPRTPASDAQLARASVDNLDNAVLDSMHTSTTESILQWPHFEVSPSLRNDYVPVFQLEQARPALYLAPDSLYPWLHMAEVDSILESFQHNVNFWYPTMSQEQLRHLRETYESGQRSMEDLDGCLLQLTLALGCASEVTSGLARGMDYSQAEVRRRDSRRKIGDLYFEAALRKLYMAHLSIDSTATHCLFFAALYFASLVRPLQAWEYISATASKCLLLLSNPPVSDRADDLERIRRIFWSCYILESDYVAELSACPVSGIARIESSVLLPGSYHTHTDSTEEEQSALYFLACISMRRLLNRVHQLLYARETGAALDKARFPYIVAELHHQLDEWREVLPVSFAFSLDTSATTTEAGGFLRQRYLTCQSVIYRPYLMWLLSSAHSGGDMGKFVANESSAEVLDHCRACLDACLMHILNLRGFAHTVMVDTWICSLSMAGAMLVLLAACRVPVLRPLIQTRVMDAGSHLEQLLGHWQVVLGSPRSPSVTQGLHVIAAADRLIKEAYKG